MQEIEVKILEVDVSKVVSKLESLGAQKTFDGNIVTSLFDFEDLRIKNSNGTMRLRMRGDVAEVTVKQKELKSGAKVAEQTEVSVSDFEKMRAILLLCGLKEFPVLTKHRVSYQIDDTHFEFDTYQGVPASLEIESFSVERIHEWVEKLGYTMDQAKDWGAHALLKHHGVEVFLR